MTITPEERVNAQRWLGYLVYRSIDSAGTSNQFDKVDGLLESSNITTTLATALLREDGGLLEHTIKEASKRYIRMLELRETKKDVWDK